MRNQDFRILVVDDQIGKEGPFQASFIERAGKQAEDFIFCSGQDRAGHNQQQIVLDQVHDLWNGRGEQRLSLILLDLQFDDADDVGGGTRFGLKVLQALREQFGSALPIVMLSMLTKAAEEANAARVDDFLAKDSITAETLSRKLCLHGIYPERSAGLQGGALSFLLTLRELRRAVFGGVREFLLLGETGTGKSELANYIHQISGCTGEFVSWFARSTNSELLFGQLFGHWKGAHEGATDHSVGAAERAHKGTLFIDEIAELGLATQTDFLEYRQRGPDGLRRVKRSGNTPAAARRNERRGLNLVGEYSIVEDRILVDTTLVSATNRPIDDETWRDNSGFRTDIFNRLGLRIRLPPLRERAEDIVPLFQGLASRASRRSVELAPEAQQVVRAHEWREGNVAELRRVAEAVVARLGSDFNVVHFHHLEGLIPMGSLYSLSAVPRPTSPKLATPPLSNQHAEWVAVELRSLTRLTELLRAAVVQTRRPTGLGSLADILKQATGVAYAPTDVKREVKKLLEPWFSPNVRQLARWNSDFAYAQDSTRVQNDAIFSSLYYYAAGDITWEEARKRIAAELDR